MKHIINHPKYLWISFFVLIFINALSSLGVLPNGTPSEITMRFQTLFTPLDLTFSIWALIYSLLFYHMLKGIKEYVWLWHINFIANALWLITWHALLFQWSVVVMVTILISLIVLNLKNNSKKHILLGSYLGWIMVATIANIAQMLITIRGYTPVAENLQTVLMLCVGSVVAIVVMFRLKNPSIGFVFVWAYVGVYGKHVSPSGFDKGYIAIVNTSLTLALVICSFIIFQLWMNSRTLKKTS
jgi:hypothetical protein